jgi:hypothetical protein
MFGKLKKMNKFAGAETKEFYSTAMQPFPG